MFVFYKNDESAIWKNFSGAHVLLFHDCFKIFTSREVQLQNSICLVAVLNIFKLCLQPVFDQLNYKYDNPMLRAICCIARHWCAEQARVALLCLIILWYYPLVIKWSCVFDLCLIINIKFELSKKNGHHLSFFIWYLLMPAIAYKELSKLTRLIL